MNSRDRFSLGAFAVLSLPSNQISMAGSTIMAWARSGKRAGRAGAQPSRSGRHQRGLADLLHAGGEVAVPEPGQPFGGLVLGAGPSGPATTRRRPAGRPVARRCAAGDRWGRRPWATRSASGGRGRGGGRAAGRCRAGGAAGSPARPANRPAATRASSPGRQPNPNRSAARRTSAASSSPGSSSSGWGTPPWLGPATRPDNGSGPAFSGSTGTQCDGSAAGSLGKRGPPRYRGETRPAGQHRRDEK